MCRNLSGLELGLSIYSYSSKLLDICSIPSKSSLIVNVIN